MNFGKKFEDNLMSLKMTQFLVLNEMQINLVLKVVSIQYW